MPLRSDDSNKAAKLTSNSASTSHLLLAYEAWKAGVMSGAIELEEIDTEAFMDRYGKLALNVASPEPASTAAE